MKRKAFVLPSTFFMITICLIYAFFSMNQMQLETITARSVIENSMLIDCASIGKKMFLDLKTEYTYFELRDMFKVNSKYYIKTNPSRDFDSVIVFNTINKTGIYEEYLVSTYLLKNNQIGLTDHPLKKDNFSLSYSRESNMLSHQFVKQAKLVILYRISTEESNLGEIISAEIQDVPYSD